jgi:hypothetical protein
MKRSEVEISLAAIEDKYFVRKHLVPERVEMFKTGYEEDINKFPRIEVAPLGSGKFVLLRGRHRRQALDLLGITKFSVIVVYGLDSDKEQFIYALTDDLSAAMPQTADDMRFVTKTMYEQGFSDKEIKAIPYPGMAKYLHQIKANERNTKLAAAKRYRDEHDVTYAEAATKFKVDEESLRNLCRGTNAKVSFKLLKQLSQLNISDGKQRATFARKARESWELGTMTNEEVVKLLTAMQDYGRLVEKNATEELRRFRQVAASQKVAAVH